MAESCTNHADRKALSSCQNCKGFFCGECLVEGNEYYYCGQEECQSQMKQRGDELELPEQYDNASLVTIASFSQPYEAEIAKTHLESEGILSFLSNENVVGINWLWSNAVGGVKLQVAEPDVEAARQILSTDYLRFPARFRRPDES